jgi:hypothetical protein
LVLAVLREIQVVGLLQVITQYFQPLLQLGEEEVLDILEELVLAVVVVQVVGDRLMVVQDLLVEQELLLQFKDLMVAQVVDLTMVVVVVVLAPKDFKVIGELLLVVLTELVRQQVGVEMD